MFVFRSVNLSVFVYMSVGYPPFRPPSPPLSFPSSPTLRSATYIHLPPPLHVFIGLSPSLFLTPGAERLISGRKSPALTSSRQHCGRVWPYFYESPRPAIAVRGIPLQTFSLIFLGREPESAGVLNALMSHHKIRVHLRISFAG